MRSTLRIVACSAGVLLACATTGAEGEGDRDLPSAGVGPFRKLADKEVTGIAPFVVDRRADGFGEPAVLTEGSDVVLYASAVREGQGVIVRTRATDGRSFFGTGSDAAHVAPTVLRPDAPWEGAAVSAPFALRVFGVVHLYYAAAGGIGLARAQDGFGFVKEAQPVLTPSADAPWETSAPSAPSAYLGQDGLLHLFYAAGISIWEATSADGVTFARVDPDPATPAVEPVLAPSPVPDPSSLLPNEKPPFDTARVADPSSTTRTTPADRFHVRVLYTGYDQAGASAIGFAARYGDRGVLARNASPVYAVKQGEAAPALHDVGDHAFLYVQQNRRAGADVYRAVAAAVAPVALELPPPAPFPAAP